MARRAHGVDLPYPQARATARATPHRASRGGTLAQSTASRAKRERPCSSLVLAVPHEVDSLGCRRLPPFGDRRGRPAYHAGDSVREMTPRSAPARGVPCSEPVRVASSRWRASARRGRRACVPRSQRSTVCPRPAGWRQPTRRSAGHSLPRPPPSPPCGSRSRFAAHRVTEPQSPGPHR